MFLNIPFVFAIQVAIYYDPHGIIESRAGTTRSGLEYRIVGLLAALLMKLIKPLLFQTQSPPTTHRWRALLPPVISNLLKTPWEVRKDLPNVEDDIVKLILKTNNSQLVPPLGVA